MKSTFRAINVAKWKRRWASLFKTSKTFLWMTVVTGVFMTVIGIGGIVGQQFPTSPVSTLKGIASQLSAQWFVQMLAIEVPTMTTKDGEEATLSKRDIASLFVRLTANVNPLDPKSMIAGELPGAAGERSVQLWGGKGNESALGPQDLMPLPGEEGGEHGGVPDPIDMTPVEEGFEAVKPNAGQPNTVPQDTNSTDHKMVFIYHSHNRESWNPELEKKSDNPNDAKMNITVLGKYFKGQLEKRGIGAAHSGKDYASTIEGYNWNSSYKYSRETIKTAMTKENTLSYFFDVHRDAARYEHSTVEIKGKKYAQVYFIIGEKNPNWKQNEKLAASIHKQLEKLYPGISRGIYVKGGAGNNGEYNQTLSPNSIVIEIGGVDNTLAESQRTIDVLADITAELIHEKQDAKPVQAPLQEPNRSRGSDKDMSRFDAESVNIQTSQAAG